MKKIVVILLVIAFAALAVVGLVWKKEKTTFESSTASMVAKGGDKISCEDSVWLLDTFIAIINEKIEQVGEPSENATKEELDNLKRKFMDTSSPSQELFQKWQSGIVTAANTRYIREPAETERVLNIIGKQFTEIYQVSMFVYSGMTGRDAAAEIVREQFCTE